MIISARYCLDLRHKGYFMLMLMCLLMPMGRPAAQTPASTISKADHYLMIQGEVYVCFETRFLNQHPELGRVISLDAVRKDSVVAWASAEAYNRFLEFGIPHSVLTPPGLSVDDLRMKTFDEIVEKQTANTWDFYPTYEAYVAMMRDFETRFPELCRLYVIGQSVMGRDIMFLKISPQPGSRRPVPRFMYTSTMHGDETVGFILTLRLIDHFLNGYGSDSDITWLLDNTEIWICPNENPDGTYRNDNSSISGATRANANGYDLNRNYPNPVSSATGPLQPETIAMISFTDTLSFTASANIHSGIELVNYPFDSWRSTVRKHADHVWWQFVSREYADTARHYSPANYMNPTSWSSFDRGITHGGDWYVVYGSRQDYMNYYRYCREMTLELSNVKMLSPSQLPAHWEYNRRSLINYIRQATYGIRGRVTDAATGLPLEASIEIIGHDAWHSEVFSDKHTGMYFRPINPGNYNLRISAPGYTSVEIHNVQVSAYERIIKDAALQKAVGTGPDMADFIVRGVFPNPANLNSVLVISLNNPVDLSITVFDISGRKLSALKHKPHGTAEAVIPLHSLLSELRSGVYLIRIDGLQETVTLRFSLTNHPN